MTGSVFHKLMLIGINSILHLFPNSALYQMFPYFTKDRCQPDRTIIIWVVPFTIFKYYHNISFMLVSIKCPYSCICVSSSLNIWLPSQWSDILADNANPEIHIENDRSRSNERVVSNKKVSSLTQIKKSHHSGKNFILSVNAPFFIKLGKAEKSCAPCKVARP